MVKGGTKMSKDQWSSEWSKAPASEKMEWPKPKTGVEINQIYQASWNASSPEQSLKDAQKPWIANDKEIKKFKKEWEGGFDLAKSNSDQTIVTVIENGEIKKVYNNRMPTHDPYVNPDSHIYYQCGCGAILDPGTKSFASLNNAASSQGWKVRWNKNGEGYQPFCVKCGEGVE